MSKKSKRLLVNGKLLRYILEKEFKGQKKAMADGIQADAKTLDAWLADPSDAPGATANQSSLQSVAKNLGLPLAALCLGTPKDSGFSEHDLAEELGGFMGVVAKMMGRQLGPLVRCIHWGHMLVDDARWFRTSWVWDYKAPPNPLYALVEITHEGPSLDAIITFQKKFGPANLLIDYGRLRHSEDGVSALETITLRGVRKKFPQKTNKIEFVTYYDGWPLGFVARANREFCIEEKGTLNEEEAERRILDPGDPLVGFRRAIVHEKPHETTDDAEVSTTTRTR